MEAIPLIGVGDVVQRKVGAQTRMVVVTIDRQFFGRAPNLTTIIYVWCTWFGKDKLGIDRQRKLRFYPNDLRHADA